MRIVYYIIILGIMLFAPVKRLDVAKLEPVEAIAVTSNNGEVTLKTDTGSIGAGSDAEEALVSLKKNAKGIIYLDTARFLLIGDEAKEAAMELKPFMRGAIQFAAYCGGDVEEETRYIDAHDLAEKPDA